MIQTTKCIRCGKPAKIWNGHVRKRNGHVVLAGWCTRICRKAWQWQGCHGPFFKKYGEEVA